MVAILPTFVQPAAHRLAGLRRAAWLAPVLLGLACSAGATGVPLDAASTAVPTSVARGLHAAAEAKLLPVMSGPLAAAVRAQPWYESLTPAGLELVAAIQRSERAAQPRGETASVGEILAFAAEQAWYGDGLGEREATSLTAVFDAYTESLSDRRAPQIGPILSPTLRFALFEAVDLAETGPIVVLVSAESEAAGKSALALTTDALPRVEVLVGAYPYRFLFIEVTDDLPEIYAGVSYDQFIALDAEYVDEGTTIHELTRSTMYSIFPTWFEEGLAHFFGYYLTDSLPEAAAFYEAELRALDATALDISHYRGSSPLDRLLERGQGFLFLNGLHEIQGIDRLSEMVRSLRTQNLRDQALLRTIVEHGDAEEQAKLARFVCESVVGTSRDYCAPLP